MTQTVAKTKDEQYLDRTHEIRTRLISDENLDGKWCQFTYINLDTNEECKETGKFSFILEALRESDVCIEDIIGNGTYWSMMKIVYDFLERGKIELIWRGERKGNYHPERFDGDIEELDKKLDEIRYERVYQSDDE